jgi:hypothetical protein
MKVFLFLVGALVFTSSASAQTYRPLRLSGFAPNDILRSIRCDVSKFAVQAKKMGLDKTYVTANKPLNVRISFQSADQEVTDVGIGAQIVGSIAGFISTPSVTYNETITQSEDGKVSVDFDILTATGPCSKSMPSVYVYTALMDRTESFAMLGYVYAQKKAIAAGKFNASGKITAWFVNIGPDFTYNVLRTYIITVESPVPAAAPSFQAPTIASKDK